MTSVYFASNVGEKWFLPAAAATNANMIEKVTGNSYLLRMAILNVRPLASMLVSKPQGIWSVAMKVKDGHRGPHRTTRYSLVWKVRRMGSATDEEIHPGSASVWSEVSTKASVGSARG